MLKNNGSCCRNGFLLPKKQDFEFVPVLIFAKSMP